MDTIYLYTILAVIYVVIGYISVPLLEQTFGLQSAWPLLHRLTWPFQVLVIVGIHLVVSAVVLWQTVSMYYQHKKARKAFDKEVEKYMKNNGLE